MRQLPAGTVTFLFTDIEGSTRLLYELGDAYAEALAHHRRVMRDVFTRRGGIEVDAQGDAFFFAFARAADAVAAADAAQRALAVGRIRVRIGIHTGRAELTDGGYVGLDVHKAARICAAAHGGQVVLSEGTRAQLNGSEVVTDLGLHRLKDLGSPEKLYQLGDATFPPLRSLNATNLPAQPSPLVGRERELSAVQELVRGHRLVTLTGPGGAGKTRLALQAAADLAPEFSDGVFWVPLASLTDPSLVLPTLAATLGATEGNVAGHIDERRMLLLVDNLEQLLDAGPTLSELLQACPNLHLLATSRAPLRLSGEQEYATPPLPDAEAVELFSERASQAEPVAAVAEICRRLDGLPLAIELAAARTRVLPPDKLLERLEQRLPLLTGGSRDSPERHRSLRATIEWSYELLPSPERQLFAQLAVFAGGFDLDAALRVCDAELDQLDGLVAQSLLRRTAQGRFFYLETIREFALDRLEASGQASLLRSRHATYFLDVARSANLTNDAEGEMRHDIVRRDIDNIRAALEWALASGQIELGLRIAGALENYWASNSPVEGRQWLRALLELGDDVAGHVRALATRAFGAASYIYGDYDEGVRAYRAALDEYRRLGDDRGVGIMLFRLAVDAQRRGDMIEAQRQFEKSLLLQRRIGFRRGEAQALSMLAGYERRAGNEQRALEMLERSAALCAEAGFTWWQLNVVLEIAATLRRLGRRADAEVRAREAVGLASRIGDRQNTIYALAELARVAVSSGALERAGLLWGAIEAEEARGRVGQWEETREDYAIAILRDGEPEFERGREAGRSMSLNDAVTEAVAVEQAGVGST